MSNLLIRNIVPPNVCDDCWAFDETGDYSYCCLMNKCMGYRFDACAHKMPDCPLSEVVDEFEENSEGCELCRDDLKPSIKLKDGNFLYRRHEGDDGILFEPIRVRYCPKCGRDLKIAYVRVDKQLTSPKMKLTQPPFAITEPIPPECNYNKEGNDSK